MSAAAPAFPVCGAFRVAFSANMAVWRQSLNDPRGRNCTVYLEQRIFCGESCWYVMAKTIQDIV